jgi:hypothetical protein
MLMGLPVSRVMMAVNDSSSATMPVRKRSMQALRSIRGNAAQTGWATRA